MTLFLHLGAHKTATTTLQNVLKHNEAALEVRGLARIKTQTRHLFWHLYRDGDREAFKKRRRTLARKLQQYDAGWPNAILSSETMFGTSDLHGVDRFYPLADTALRVLAQLTSGMDRKVIFYVRRQDDFIESSFINRLQTLATSLHLDHARLLADTSWSSFAHYLDSFVPAQLSWLNLIERMETHFGADNLIIRPFETIRRGKASYAEAFLAPMCATDGLELSPPIYENRSFSAKALEEFIRLAPQQGFENLRSLRLRLQDEYPNTVYPRPTLLSPDQRQEILQAHASGNETLFARYIREGDREGISYQP